MKRGEMENKNNSGGAGSIFLLGLLIGVLITLVLTTKRGREILKEFMDKTIQKISDLEKSVDSDKVKKEIMHLATEFAQKQEKKVHEAEPDKHEKLAHKPQKKD
jgi:hypothetical protein